MRLLFLSLLVVCFPLEGIRSITMASSEYNYMTTKDGAKIRIAHWSPGSDSNTYYRDDAGRLQPTVLLLQGRASFIEKFDEIVDALLNRGYSVWALDWRGQGVSTRLTENRQKGHIDSYETYITDLNQFLTEYVLPDANGPIIALGQSMGGHLVLRYLHDYPGHISGAILTAPMLDVNTGGYPKGIAKFLAKFTNKIGLGENYIFGHGDFLPTKEPYEDNFLTHDRERFFKLKRLQMEHPHLIIGGVTFGWLDATFESIAKLSQPGYLQDIKVPVLILAAGEEQVVDNSGIQRICDMLPQCHLKVYENARHQILSEVDEILKQFWNDFDHFIDEQILRQPQSRSTEGRLIESAQLTRMERRRPTLSKDINRLKPNF